MEYYNVFVLITTFTLCWIRLCCGETLLVSVDTVQVAGGEPVPANGNNNLYDVPAGATIIVHCNISGAVATANLRYPTNSHALNQRFEEGARVSRISTDKWMFSDIRAYDTGWLECYDTTDHEEQSAIYIFVNDVNSLYVPLKDPRGVTIYRGEYVPCLPTHSEANFVLLHSADRNPRTYNNTRGVLLLSRADRRPLYTCRYTYNSSEETQSIGSIVVKSNEAPSIPAVAPLHGKFGYQPGETLIMNCSVISLNVVDFDWKYPALTCEITSPPVESNCRGREGRVTQSTPTIYNRNTGLVGSSLTITGLVPSDSGTYECGYKRISDTEFVGFTKSVPPIKVYPGPVLTGNMTTVTVKKKASETAILWVKLEESPEATVTWMFNSQPLDINGDDTYSAIHQQVVMNGTEYRAKLTIGPLEKSHAGEYILTASVADIVFTKIFIVEVQVPPTLSVKYSYKNENSDMDVPIVYVQPNDSLRITCMVTGGIPMPSMKWLWQVCGDTKMCEARTGINAWTEISSSIRNDDLNSLYIDEIKPNSRVLVVTPEKSSRFICSATNDVSTVDRGLIMIVSVLPEEAKGVGFTLETRTLAKNLVEGDSLLMECYVSKIHCMAANDVMIFGKDDALVVTKNKGNFESFNPEGDSYVISYKFYNLTTDWTNREYACRCNNGQQGEHLRLNVSGYESPKFEASVTSGAANMTVGQTRTFLCRPTGIPLPKVAWYKDGKVLMPSTIALLSKEGYNLTLVRVRAEDAGDYGCVGVTNRDSIYSNFTLTITEPVTGLSTGQIAMIVVIVIVVLVLAVIITICIVRKYCRKKYTPHTLLLPSKEMINPDIPLDEQTDALPYDIGWEFPMGGLKLGMLLGQGAFGRVLKAEAMNIEEGVASTTVAVKTVRDHHDIEQVKALISELKILIHIGQHLNIVNLLGACTKDISKGHILVIVEFCRFGNLRSYLLKHKAHFNPTLDRLDVDNSMGVKLGHLSVDMTGDEDYLDPGTSSTLHTAEKPVTLRDIMSWCYQMARGMEYLASIDYIHRDLAARNVLLADDNIVKICDFGLAKDIYKYQEYQKQTDGPLPIKWMALESLTHKVFNVRTDVWAYGITAWELFSLAATPYPGVDIDDTFIDRLQEGYRMEIPKHCPEQIYQEVMLNCWHPDADKRPNFAELADIMGEWLDIKTKQHLQSLEDPYLRSRDSRTDITIRHSSVRQRDRSDLESNYLPTKALQKPNGEAAAPKPAPSNYYNTSPSGSQPINKSKKNWRQEPATSVEKLSLQVHVCDEDGDDLDMPDMPAPSPSKWERQSHLGRHTVAPEDALSFGSVDSESARPPSYNYVMKKSGPPEGAQGDSASSSGLSRPNAGSSRDALNHSPSDKAYIETTC